MKGQGAVLLDTGPLVAFLVSDSDHHDWVCAQWKRLSPPMLTCEPVLTEAAFLMKREGCEADPLFMLLERGVLRVGLEVEDQLADLRVLMRRYRDRPMSLADACLVRLAEMHPGGRVLTFDTDFRIYRRHGNKVIPVLMPED
ncbi:MAG: type II toxin-antitoxin system VapC family toxin [Verrucomicrobiales bacterium]|nr:type II toxin-antitoxin system VapC family toxin [Verrucomicrobiales bacterium]